MPRQDQINAVIFFNNISDLFRLSFFEFLIVFFYKLQLLQLDYYTFIFLLCKSFKKIISYQYSSYVFCVTVCVCVKGGLFRVYHNACPDWIIQIVMLL